MEASTRRRAIRLRYLDNIGKGLLCVPTIKSHKYMHLVFCL